MRMSRLIAVLLTATIIAAVPATAGGGGGHGDAKKAKPKAAKRSHTTLVSYVMVDPFMISVVQDQEVRGSMIIGFGLDIPDEALRLKAEAIMPRLRDGWLMALNRYAGLSLRPKRAADVALIATKLENLTTQILGQPGAKVLMHQAVVDVR